MREVNLFWACFVLRLTRGLGLEPGPQAEPVLGLSPASPNGMGLRSVCLALSPRDWGPVPPRDSLPTPPLPCSCLGAFLRDW